MAEHPTSPTSAQAIRKALSQLSDSEWLQLKCADPREQIYSGRRPPDYVLAHNRVTHHDCMPHGMNGFRRFWIPQEWIGKSFVKCKCGWRSDLGEHYRNRDASDFCFTVEEVMSWTEARSPAAEERAFKRRHKNGPK